MSATNGFTAYRDFDRKAFFQPERLQLGDLAGESLH
jgi:hypothetical protein